MSQDTTFGDSSQGLSFTNELSVVEQTLFAGDGLVAQPNKVRLTQLALVNISHPTTP